MNNYEYIIASLPVIVPGTQREVNPESLIEEILSQCSTKDRHTVEFFLSGFNGANLSKEFYLEAASHHNRFIRQYFTMDLNVRNAKVEFLNRTLGRPADQDIMLLDEDASTDFEGRQELDAILYGSNLLERERGIDDYLWKAIDEMTISEVFSIEVILGFIAKLKITDRWLKLDPERGRELFRNLISEIKNTKKI